MRRGVPFLYVRCELIFIHPATLHGRSSRISITGGRWFIAMTAGMTFLGQFLDHDITLDLKSPLSENSFPRRTTNFRTAAFNLDSLYGDGPQGSPELYDTSGNDIKFRVDRQWVSFRLRQRRICSIPPGLLVCS